MLRDTGPRLPLIALLILGGAAARAGVAEQLAARKALQAPRVETLAKALVARQGEFGLPQGTGFTVLSQGTDDQGRTHVRFQQTYKGIPVWRARALGHLEANGTVAGFQSALATGIELEVAPTRSADQAANQVLSDLGTRVDRLLVPTRSSLVVLPNARAGSLKFKRDPQSRRFVLDEEFSNPVALSKGGYTLAYHVAVTFAEAGKGKRSLQYLVDAHSGAILDRWDPARRASAKLGHSQYSGDVTLATSHNSGDSNFYLVDPSRGTVAQPYYGYIGNQTFWLDTSFNIHQYFDVDDVWGDGLNFVETNAADGTNGQTAAVDAHYGGQVTWDMLQNVFGRDGIDDAGSSIASFVHAYLGQGYDNAFWDSSDFSMNYGDGTDFTTLTCLDVTAHEMGHGVMDGTAGLEYSDESGGLNESNSDILGTLGEFYARSGGTGSSIPDTATGANWLIGEQLAASPLRYMYKPSLDGGWSYDFWFDGMGLDDVHYSSGPGNRFFYFLAQGTGTGDYASDYLPGGMTGIGNQKAGQIWYTAMRDHVASTTADYAAARTATLAAAVSLGYGTSSPEYAAVENAWAAVNVGPAHGQTAKVEVRLPVYSGNPSYLGTSRYILLPMSSSCTIPVTVTGATDSSLAWAVGQSIWPFGISTNQYAACTITAGGVLTTASTSPSTRPGAAVLSASSLEDPLQFAVGLVLQYDMDTDTNSTLDAADMAAIARNYGASVTAFASGDLTGNGGVNDNDVAVFAQAFQNAFGQ